MIKNIILFFSLVAFSFVVAAQDKTRSAPPAKINQHLKVFKQAIISGDAGTASIALNYYPYRAGQ